MELVELTVAPLNNSIGIELFLRATFRFVGSSIIPISINGYIYVEEVKISNIELYQFGTGIEEKFMPANRTRDIDRRVTFPFLAKVSREAINLMNESRAKSSKGDVKLRICFSLNCLETRFESQRVQQPMKEFTVPAFQDDSLFVYRTTPLQTVHKISASDWLHDFYPVFHLEKFIVLELPVFVVDEKTVKKDDLGKRVRAALEAFKIMRSALERSDWNLIIKESRPVWELHRKNKQIAKLLADGGLSDPAIGSFNVLLQNCFDFASKLIHREDRAFQLMPASNAAKEDAILIYTMAASIINLIGQKLTRSGS